MKKNKYYVLVCVILIIALLLFVSFCIYEVIMNKTPSIIPLDNASYATVKTHNINTRTKVSFPVFNDFILNEKSSNDYEKVYSNSKDATLFSVFNKIDGTPSKGYINQDYQSLEDEYKTKGYTVSSNEIKCNHECRRIQVFQNDVIYLVIIRVYIEFSKEDIFKLSYEQEKENIPEDRINTIINNIYITNDAEYLSGEADDEYLRITLGLLNNAHLHISFDSNMYEEIEDGDNGIHQTTIRNKESDSVGKLRVLFTYQNKSILETIDTYYKTNNRNKVTIGDKELYEYTLENEKIYAIILDNDSALILDESIKPNDIKRLFIEKDDNE